MLAGSITYVFFRRLRANAAQHNTIYIVAASEDLPAGITLTAKNVTTIAWPSDVALAGSFTKAEEVVGRPLIRSLAAKEPVMQRDLGVEGSGIGLSGKIPPGMRATSVRSNEVVGVAGFLYPGSRVDVLATYVIPGNPGPLTQTVLQDVEVLTAGQTIEPDPQGKPQQVNVVTLLLAPEDSQKLLLASTQGTIQFVLRSGVDDQKVQLMPTKLDQLVPSSRPPVADPAKKGSKRHVSPKVPTVYVVEVIQGTQKTVEKF